MLKRTVVMLCGFVFILVLTGQRCRDPNDFKPPEDTLIQAPDAPMLLEPSDGYVTMTQGLNYYVALSWDSVTGGEIYIIEITGDGYGPEYFQTDTTRFAFCILIADMLGEYEWRVCAGSSEWQGGYTAYSSPRRFEARFQPAGPVLVYPYDGAVFYLDSLPSDLTLRWDSVQDEEFYELEVRYGADLIEHVCPDLRYYTIPLADTGYYSWRVRAISNLWQYPGAWSAVYFFSVISGAEGKKKKGHVQACP